MGMDTEPLISVIVPVYKVEQYLDQCVTSIVHQTYSNLEIILIDDGSPDRCPQMCDAWGRHDTRIRVIHKENGGLSSARNAGLDVASGQRIAFVDSDDWIDSDMLSVMSRWMDEREDADVVMCGTLRSFEDGTESSVETEHEERLFTSEQAIHSFLYHRDRMVSAMWNKLFKADLFQQENGLRFPNGLNSEDYYMLAHIYRLMHGIYVNSTPLYHYRIRENSISTATVNKHTFDKAIIADKCCQYLREHQCGDEFGYAYFRMQGRYDIVYDLVTHKAGSKLIAQWKHELGKTARVVYKDPSVSVGRKMKIMAMCVCPRLYHRLTERR